MTREEAENLILRKFQVDMEVAEARRKMFRESPPVLLPDATPELRRNLEELLHYAETRPEEIQRTQPELDKTVIQMILDRDSKFSEEMERIYEESIAAGKKFLESIK